MNVLSQQRLCLFLAFGGFLFCSGCTENVIAPPGPVPTIKESIPTGKVFDHTSDRWLLFSKTSIGDLWLRDGKGHERCVGTNVVRASFSPDGKKFAFATQSEDLFIKTIDGKQLAQLTRARDYSWSSNSLAITFSAIAAADYPELEQIVVFDLISNQTRLIKSE